MYKPIGIRSLRFRPDRPHEKMPERFGGALIPTWRILPKEPNAQTLNL